jgi:hypothetical protein
LNLVGKFTSVPVSRYECCIPVWDANRPDMMEARDGVQIECPSAFKKSAIAVRSIVTESTLDRACVSDEFFCFFFLFTHVEWGVAEWCAREVQKEWREDEHEKSKSAQCDA